MPTMQIYNDDSSGRLFDGNLTLSITVKMIPLTKGAATRILRRFGYRRTGKWRPTSWGWRAMFKRHCN